MRKRYLFGVWAVFALLSVGCGKPRIENDCTMNGFGAGDCNFTNTGTAPGSVCGKVVVQKKKGAASLDSAKFCSGEVGKRSTTKVEFKVPGVGAMCIQNDGTKWSDVCEFSFQSDDGPK